MTNDRPSRPARTAPAQRPGSAAARRKAAAFRAAEAARLRRRHVLRWSGAVIVVAAAITAIVVVVLTGGAHHGSGRRGQASDAARATLTGPPGPEGIALEEGTPLAPATDAATGQTVAGIECNSMEQADFHIHTHLTVYVHGALRPLPGGIGAVAPVPQRSAHSTFDGASRCFYWLHTHAQDGIIHVEAPNHATYTLGQFFAIWRQPLTGDQVGPAHGTVTAYVDGHRYPGDPATITLAGHEDVQLDVGTPAVVPHKVDWSGAQL